MRIVHILAGAASTVAAAAPLSAQTYPYPYPQQTYPQQAYPQQAYPQYPQAYPQYQYPQAYPQTGYAYPGQQGYGQGVVGQVINQLLGNRYNVTDRTAVQQCATAAMSQAAYQYRPRAQGYGYNGYNQAYNPAAMRVTAITDVQRRNNGLRVSGLLNSGLYAGGYGQGYGGGYGNQAYATGDLTFRCNVAYNGQVTNVRIGRNTAYRR